MTHQIHLYYNILQTLACICDRTFSHTVVTLEQMVQHGSLKYRHAKNSLFLRKEFQYPNEWLDSHKSFF